MKHKKLFKLRFIVAITCILGMSAQAQTWPAPTLTGSAITTGTSYYVYNVGSNGYLTAGGWWGTQSNISAQPRANASTSVVKYTATNTSGSLWTFQYNLAGSDVANWFLTPTNANSSDGSVETNDYDWSGRLPNRSWNVIVTDATNNIYSIQVPSTYAGYVATQYLGSSPGTEDTNGGTCNVVRYNRPDGDKYTKWKFVTQADLDLYDARILLNKYMMYAKKKAIDISPYISIYEAGVTADINTAAAGLLTALGRTDVTSSITNPSFETNSFAGWTNDGFTTQSNDPGQGWTKDGSYYVEKYTDKSNWNLSAASLTQTVSGLSNGLYELVASGHAVQQNGGNPLHTGAFITAGTQSTEVVAGQNYSIADITVTDGTLSIGYALINPVKCNWTGVDNFRLYYYGPLAIPLITPSKTEFSFNANDNYLTDNVSVTSVNLSEAITISAPAGISVVPGTLPSNATNATVNISYDGSTPVNGNITFTSGSTTSSIAVTASPNTGCFVPLFASGNLVSNPECTDIATYNSWGNEVIIQGANSYCGSSVQVTGDCGGSIDYSLTGKLSANSHYRLKAMLYTNENGAAITLNGCGIGGTTDDYLVEVNTGGSWELVDFTFTTGTLGTAQNFWLNSCGSINGIAKNATDIRMDNFELYELTPYTALQTPTELTKSTVYIKENSIIADFELAQSSNVEISVFNAQGMLLSKCTESFYAGKNSKVIETHVVSGIYLVRMTQSGQSITTKVIK